jgi:feruloyl esterase
VEAKIWRGWLYSLRGKFVDGNAQELLKGRREPMKIAMIFCVALLANSLFRPSLAAGASCEDLAAFAPPNTTITLAELVGARAFEPRKDLFRQEMSKYEDLPASCRVAGTIKPSKDSNIRFEVLMPVSGWNGKFLGIGDGGFLGEVPSNLMVPALARGYATASTAAGLNASAIFALGNPEKVIDFAYRGVHEMTAKAKVIVAAFYGSGPRLSYWTGCSGGGRQALEEAQRFPRDYDGIIAGAPSIFFTHLRAGQVWIAQATHKDPASYIPPSKYPLIHKAVLEACDTLDGVKDGVLENPRRCHFDPKVLECKDADGPACLNAAQVEAARKLYAGATNPRTGKQIFPGLEPGSELGWAALAGGQDVSDFTNSYFKYLVFKNPNWNFRTFNFDTDAELSDELYDKTLNATNPNLKEFVGHGGKLIMYHGWADEQVSPQTTVDYYNSVLSAMGARETDRSVRLFMVPGMNHCGGGGESGPSSFDTNTAIEQWVEKGKAPEQIIASHSTGGKAGRTRPSCPYPQIAKYTGTGSTDDAANFICTKE